MFWVFGIMFLVNEKGDAQEYCPAVWDYVLGSIIMMKCSGCCSRPNQEKEGGEKGTYYATLLWLALVIWGSVVIGSESGKECRNLQLFTFAEALVGINVALVVLGCCISLGKGGRRLASTRVELGRAPPSHLPV